jgi:hypothetical protein
MVPLNICGETVQPSAGYLHPSYNPSTFQSHLVTYLINCTVASKVLIYINNASCVYQILDALTSPVHSSPQTLGDIELTFRLVHHQIQRMITSPIYYTTRMI